MVKLINPWMVAGVLVAVLGAGAAGFRLGSDHQIAKQADRKELIAEAAVAFDGMVAKHAANIKPVHKTIQNNLETILRENTYYRDCVNGPDVQRLLDDARANRGPAEREAGVSP